MVSLNETNQGGSNHGQTISRAAALLRALARSPQGSRLTDVAGETGLTKPTALRLLRALAGEGLVFCDASGGWRLGLGLVSLGAAAGNRDGLKQIASEPLARIAAETGDTVFFSLREGVEIMCVDRQEGPYPIRTLMLAPGDRRPLGIGAAGMAVLAFLDDGERAQTIGQIEPRLREWPGHTAELLEERAALARRRGYALNNGQILAAMWAVGVPIRDGARNIIGALSVAAITERLHGGRLSEVVTLLKAEAQGIENRFRINVDGEPVAPRVGPPVRVQGRRGGRRPASARAS